jgi:hypothetical protein
VPPFATPALCHASASFTSPTAKPIVPPLAAEASLPSIGFEEKNLAFGASCESDGHCQRPTLA